MTDTINVTGGNTDINGDSETITVTGDATTVTGDTNALTVDGDGAVVDASDVETLNVTGDNSVVNVNETGGISVYEILAADASSLTLDKELPDDGSVLNAIFHIDPALGAINALYAGSYAHIRYLGQTEATALQLALVASGSVSPPLPSGWVY